MMDDTNSPECSWQLVFPQAAAEHLGTGSEKTFGLSNTLRALSGTIRPCVDFPFIDPFDVKNGPYGLDEIGNDQRKLYKDVSTDMSMPGRRRFTMYMSAGPLTRLHFPTARSRTHRRIFR